MKTWLIIKSLGCALLFSSVSLVPKETIEVVKKETKSFKLSNGLQVIYREVKDNPLIQIEVAFHFGLKDIAPGKKPIAQLLWNTVGQAAKGYPKEKLFGVTEKYALDLGCTGGIEYSACSLGTTNEHVDVGLPLLAAVVAEPTLDAKDVELSRQRLEAELKAASTDPGRYVNEIVNDVFYPSGHPYRNTPAEALAELSKITREDLVKAHASALNAAGMHIVVVTSLTQDQVKQKLESAFGKIPSAAFARTPAPAPTFDGKNAFRFENRAIPTAYIRAKVIAPAIDGKDAVATRLMFEILSEELGDEIRTKRSLSYAVNAFVIQYSLGVGVLSASTSKPKETIEALNVVIKKLKETKYSDVDLDHFKRGFATGYYLTQETHASLAGAISTSTMYFGRADELYEFPERLALVTSDDIQRLARDLLVNLRVGVIYDRTKFEDAWVDTLIKSNLASAAPPKK